MTQSVIRWLNAHLRTPLYLNSYLLIVMRAFGTVFGFVFWALAARLMDETDVGLASGIMSATMLLSGVAQLGLGYGLTRHLHRARNPNRLLSTALIASALMGLALALIFLACLRWWSPALLPLYAHPAYLLFFVVLVVSWSLSTLLHWIFVARRQVIYSFTRQTGHMAVAVALLFGLHYVMPGFTAALVAHMVAAIFSVLFSWQALPKAQPGFRFSLNLRDLWRPSLGNTFARYSMVNFVADQFNKVPDTLLPLLIINQFGPERGAYFFVVWTIGRAVSTWVSSMSQSLFAEGSSNPAAAGALVRRAALLGTALSSGLAAMIVLFGPWILGIYGPTYVAEGLGLLDFVAVAAVPTVLNSLFSSFLLIHDRLRAMSVLRIVNSVTGLVFIYIGISQIGFLGAGIGWLTAQIVVLIGCQIWWQWQKRHNPSTAATVEQAEPGA